MGTHAQQISFENRLRGIEKRRAQIDRGCKLMIDDNGTVQLVPVSNASRRVAPIALLGLIGLFAIPFMPMVMSQGGQPVDFAIELQQGDAADGAEAVLASFEPVSETFSQWVTAARAEID